MKAVRATEKHKPRILIKETFENVVCAQIVILKMNEIKNLSGASANSYFRQCFLRPVRERDAVCGSFGLIHAERRHLGGRIWTNP